MCNSHLNTCAMALSQAGTGMASGGQVMPLEATQRRLSFAVLLKTLGIGLETESVVAAAKEQLKTLRRSI